MKILYLLIYHMHPSILFLPVKTNKGALFCSFLFLRREKYTHAYVYMCVFNDLNHTSLQINYSILLLHSVLLNSLFKHIQIYLWIIFSSGTYLIPTNHKELCVCMCVGFNASAWALAFYHWSQLIQLYGLYWEPQIQIEERTG